MTIGTAEDVLWRDENGENIADQRFRLGST